MRLGLVSWRSGPRDLLGMAFGWNLLVVLAITGGGAYLGCVPSSGVYMASAFVSSVG